MSWFVERWSEAITLFDVGRSMFDVGRSSFEEFNTMCKCGYPGHTIVYNYQLTNQLFYWYYHSTFEGRDFSITLAESSYIKDALDGCICEIIKAGQA